MGLKRTDVCDPDRNAVQAPLTIGNVWAVFTLIGFGLALSSTVAFMEYLACKVQLGTVPEI